MPTAPTGAAGRLAARAAVLALAVAGLSLGAVLTAPPVAAHTALADSSPAAGEVLDAAPSEVILRFGDDLLAMGAFLLVVDAQGTDWVASGPDIERSTATADLRPDMPDGRYEIRWQVVAEDGHPISGIIPFGVGEAGPEPAVTTPPVDAPAPPADGPPPAASELGTNAPEALRLTLIGLGGAAAGLIIAALILRRRPVRASNDQKESTHD